MKKLFVSITFITFLIPSISLADFSQSLKYGSRGDAVSELQDFLNDQGFTISKIDGKFGFGTLKAVKAWQTSVNLTADGYFGRASRVKANDILTSLLKDSNTAEQNETGTITSTFTISGCTSTTGFSTLTGQRCDGTAPITYPVTDSGTQNRLDTLSTQVNTLTQQLQNQTQLQQQIVQNTQPVVQNQVQPPVNQPTPVVLQGNIKVLETVYSSKNGVPRINGMNIDSIDATISNYELVTLGAKSFSYDGKQNDSPVTVTTNDPDLPSSFVIPANRTFYVGNHGNNNPATDCSNDNHDCVPISAGTFYFTFTNSELNVSKTIQVSIK